MNVEGGFWMLGTERAAADHLDVTVVPALPGRRFAIGSDGLLRLVELFGIASLADLLTIDDADALGGGLDWLRQVERAEWSRAAYSRVEVHDDASFLQGTVEENQ